MMSAWTKLLNQTAHYVAERRARELAEGFKYCMALLESLDKPRVRNRRKAKAKKARG
jgi:hypothetical protein